MSIIVWTCENKQDSDFIHQVQVANENNSARELVYINNNKALVKSQPMYSKKLRTDSHWFQVVFGGMSMFPDLHGKPTAGRARLPALPCKSSSMRLSSKYPKASVGVGCTEACRGGRKRR